MDALDDKLNQHYLGRVVRKDLLHALKKGTNVPSFVLEFLLAKYCASDDPAEVEAGKKAVVETLEQNYVRPDEANQAQSTVQQKGKHKFIDKVHVRYVEKEKRHWAEMENFGSRRIAVAEQFYRDNDRMLTGGIWAEAVVGHNDIEEDNYAFYIEQLKPIQLSRFDFEEYISEREQFTRDEWLSAIIRTIGLAPEKMSRRLQFHFIARLLPFVQANYNFIELGPRGTGKSYNYSEFSPYSTLISGGQATTPILFYNNAKRQVGLVGFWDIVAFDEVAGIRVKDPDSIQIMKDFMANGRFSRGVEVIANASLAFVGNIDYSIAQLVNSAHFDLFYPLPDVFDLAVMDRFHTYLPGWEMPKNTSSLLTSSYGFITDYLAAAFHHQFQHDNRFDWVSSHVKLGPTVEGRDEVGIKKTIAGFLKILHPVGEPTPEELEEYVAYAVEGRRRVKEQMNKRKTDDEYANINLSYIDRSGREQVVYCPESKDAPATQSPSRRHIDADSPHENRLAKKKIRVVSGLETEVPEAAVPPSGPEPGTGEASGGEPVVAETPANPAERQLQEQHVRILYGDTGNSYERLFGDYITGARQVEIEDSYIRSKHQVNNLIRFCELLVKKETVRRISLRTGYDSDDQQQETVSYLEDLAQSLRDLGIEFTYEFDDLIHDREIRFDNGWRISIGRGL
ncbi:MAG: BREX system Lon protease-like protein BrxL, partial [Spirochaetaceae bacterium]